MSTLTRTDEIVLRSSQDHRMLRALGENLQAHFHWVRLHPRVENHETTENANLIVTTGRGVDADLFYVFASGFAKAWNAK